MRRREKGKLFGGRKGELDWGRGGTRLYLFEGEGVGGTRWTFFFFGWYFVGGGCH